jgi:polyhydroxybutyrate depolymerase
MKCGESRIHCGCPDLKEADRRPGDFGEGLSITRHAKQVDKKGYSRCAALWWALAVIGAGCVSGCGSEDALVTAESDGQRDGVLTGASSSSSSATGGGAEGDDGQTLLESGSSTDSDTPAFTCSGKRAEQGNKTLSLRSGGNNRRSLIHVPPSYDPSKGTTLVLNFHGVTSTPERQAEQTRMNEESDARGFLVAYPAGVLNSWNGGQCCGTAWFNSVDDVQFVADLITKIEEEYCIDPRRIFAAGLSNGGFMTYRLACELSDRIAAVAVVAGSLGVEPATCTPSRAMPVLHFHGTADPVVPYNGGLPLLHWQVGGTLDFRSVDETLSFWRTLEGCSDASQVVYQQGDSTCVKWPGCDYGSEVGLCTIDGGGHTWPGGATPPILGHTTHDLSANDMMLDFFEAHPMD